MNDLTSQDLSQPEVELVNTRASNGNIQETLDEFLENENDITPDSRVNDISGNGNDYGLSPEGVVRCIAWCRKLQQSKLFQRDNAPQTSAAVSRYLTKSTSRTTIGIVLRGCVISELVPGGPAHCSGELNPGDRIIRVDGEQVTEDNISIKLIGCDTPETVVALSVSRGIEEPCRDVNLTRAPAGIIGDRVRLFELFAAQKERAVIEESSRIQCQMWLDNILRDLLEAKRSADDQARRCQEMTQSVAINLLEHTYQEQRADEGQRRGDIDDVRILRQKVETQERHVEQQAQAIRELKQELEQKRAVERELRNELSQSLQPGRSEEKSGIKSLGPDPRNGLNDLLVCTKIELDKAKESLKMAKLDATQSRAAMLDLQEEFAVAKGQVEGLQLELDALKGREADMQKTIVESAQRLEVLQAELAAERKRADDEFRESINKDVSLAKLREELGEARRRFDDLKNQLPSSTEVAETYLASVADLNQRCLGLQKDVNTILMLHKKMYEAVCRTSSIRPCGIGVRLRALAEASGAGAAGTVIIESVHEGGPASQSGQVFAGDILVKIDGCEVNGLSMDEVRQRIIGLQGTNLTLHLQRVHEATLNTVELTRSGGGASVSLPNLEDQTADACALADNLYASLDQARYLVEEVQAEKEQMKKTFSVREAEILRTMSKWAENFQGQQLAKYFKSWVRLVLMGLVHKQMTTIIKKRSARISVMNSFSQFINLISAKRQFSKLNLLYSNQHKLAVSKAFGEWKLFCSLWRRVESLVIFNQIQKNGFLLKRCFESFCHSADRSRTSSELAKTNRLNSKVGNQSFNLSVAALFNWIYLTWKRRSERHILLNCQSKYTYKMCSICVEFWKWWTLRQNQVRLRVGRLIKHSVNQALLECMRIWVSTTRWKSCLRRIISARQASVSRFKLAPIISAFKSLVMKTRQLRSGLKHIRHSAQRACCMHVLSIWLHRTKIHAWSSKTLNHRHSRFLRECLLHLFGAWRKLVEMKGASEANNLVKAQSLAQRISDNNFVKQLGQYTERTALLQEEVAIASKSLQNEMKKNAELEAALSNARDEIGAYSQQIEYLRKQVREAWAASDAARTDLSAAIKSNDQMRNALFGRIDKDVGAQLLRSAEMVQSAKHGVAQSTKLGGVQTLQVTGAKLKADQPIKEKEDSDFADA